MRVSGLRYRPYRHGKRPELISLAGVNNLLRQAISIVLSVFLTLGTAPPASAIDGVVLQSPTSPSVGQPGITTITVTGSGFPGHAILPQDVTVTLKPATAGAGPSGSTTATLVTVVKGNIRKVSFLIPASIIVPVPTPYLVSLSGTDSEGEAFASSNSASLTVNPPPKIVSVSPTSGNTGQSLSVTIIGSFTNFVQGVTQASFGAGISVGGGAEGAFGLVTVSSATTATAQIAIDVAASGGPRTVTIKTGLQQASLSNAFTVIAGPAISDFNPKSAPVGTLVNITGSNFISATGTGPQVTLNKQGGGTITAPVSTFTGTAISFVIPDGAATGPLTVTVGTQSAVSTSPLTIVPPSSFSLVAVPSTANLIQGQSATYAVSLNSTNGFSQLAALAVSGLPSGISASFSPTQITAGQTALLTVKAPASQPTGSAALTITAAATVNGIPVSQSVNAVLNVQPVTTTFLGRTVVQNPTQDPLAGVTITILGVDGNGNRTACSGQTRSDAAGNFMIANLPAGCVGAQLIRYDGTTATSPPGTYAGVDLLYTFVAGQVTTPPFVIHLPRIDNAETKMVQQNAATDQTFTFSTIPGLSVTVYAGTIFTLVDGTQPNPFPLIGIQVPVDRLPDEMPMNSSTVGAFIVAFQPANSTASQPVAVTFPNTLNTPPGTANIELDTLNPIKGVMVKYGTGTVSNNGAQIVPDFDPAHPGHRFGLVHFDWHGPMAPTPPQVNPSPDPPAVPPPAAPRKCPPPQAGRTPIDLSSGIEVLTEMDMAIGGLRGGISIVRIYRSLSNNAGPFGIGTSHNYGYQLDTSAFVRSGQGLINLVMPDGNQFPFNLQPSGTFINSTIPSLQGAVLTNPSFGTYSLRWKDGTTFQFESIGGNLSAFLVSITDSNTNTITLVRNPTQPAQLTQITDPVGRGLTLSYDSSNRVTSITDSIGRNVQYIYNSQGTLAAVTNPMDGVESYTYDSQNRLTQITDRRGLMVSQISYDQNGRAVQLVQADGGIFRFAYTLLNPLVPTSPVVVTTVTNPLGNQTTYHFSPQGFLLDVTDAAGQMKTFTRDPGTNLLLSVTGTASCNICGNLSSGNRSFVYDANGNTLTSTDALGNITTFTYDPVFNKVTSIKDPLGNITRFGYDTRGNLLTSTNANGNTASFTYDSSGLLTQITDQLNQKTTVSFDSSSNPVTFTDALGQMISFVYDSISRPLEGIDNLGRRTGITWDALNRMVAQTDPQANTTSVAYDAVGNLLSTRDAKGNITSFTYDSMNQLVTKTTPLGKTDVRKYDLNGNLIGFTDRRGQTAQLSYDALNRLTSSSYQDGSTVTRSYDANGYLLHVVDSQGGSFDLARDLAGHLTSASSQFGAVKYAYDSVGRVVSRQVVGQPAVQYSYDPAGNLLSASMSQASVNFAYDARNQILRVSRGNGVSTSYTYDQVGRLLSVTHSSTAGILNSQSYTYDAAGNKSAVTTNIAQPLVTQPVTYQVDVGNRLIGSAAGSNTTTYAYDDNGNLISKTDSGGTATNTWDSRNRLQSISAPDGQKTTFLYDFKGNLISQTDSGPTLNLTRNFVLDDLTDVAYVSQSNSDNVLVLAGRFIDRHLAVVHSSGQVEYGLTDANNSTVATVDGSGRSLGTFLYEPFGQASTMGSNYPFQYTGRVPIGNSLYNYRARFYDSSIERFISEDPVSLAAGTNLYRYARNNPVNRRDPQGSVTAIAAPPVVGASGFDSVPGGLVVVEEEEAAVATEACAAGGCEGPQVVVWGLVTIGVLGGTALVYKIIQWFKVEKKSHVTKVEKKDSSKPPDNEPPTCVPDDCVPCPEKIDNPKLTDYKLDRQDDDCLCHYVHVVTGDELDFNPGKNPLP